MITTLSLISSDTALSLVAAALKEAKAQGLTVAAAVVDTQGVTVASARMDGGAPPILIFAEDKAYTAATMRRTTEAFAARMGSSSSLTLGVSTRQRLLAWGGGLPIVHEGRVVGGIGVSGATDDEDIAIGQAVLKAHGLGWEV